jgi:hypothetical protein
MDKPPGRFFVSKARTDRPRFASQLAITTRHPAVVQVTPEVLGVLEHRLITYVIDASRKDYAEERAAMENGWFGPDVGGEASA